MSRLVPAPDALVGKRFDVAVAKMLGISRAKAAELIESGQARVLGRDISKSSTLQSGETVEFDIVEERTEPEPIARDMAVVYEDDDVIVVDKPVGVAAHASVGWTGPTVLGSLLDRGVHITSYGAAGRQGIVSRLDVGTSGLMLVCKSDLAYVEMRRQFAEHEVVKTYHALVQGNLKENKATRRRQSADTLPVQKEDFAGRRILLVEDNEINMEIARTLLEFRNASVDGACNGQQAVKMFRSSPQNHYDAVLMDVRMPVMDGIAATQAIRGLDRADAATVPILAMTANAFAEDIERSRKAGMNEHLAKPIEPETLYARLASYFR